MARAYWPSGDTPPPRTLRVYHVLLFLSALWLMRLTNQRLKILPYRTDLARMDELLMLIKGSEPIRTQSSTLGSIFSRFLPGGSRERQIDARKDPRLVEQEFIELLTELRPYPPTKVRRTIREWLSIRPEITFILDEMDKL